MNILMFLIKKMALLTAILILFISRISAQEGIGIGTESVNPDAIFEIDSQTDGLLIPRMNTGQRNAIDVSSDGLMVYDTDFNALFYWDSNQSIWRKLVATESNLDVDLGANSLDAGSIHADNYELNVSGNGPVPQGGIIMWYGSIASVPTGWALCNGSNGTPDLRDRFIVGAGSSYSPQSTGGSNSVTLSLAQIPSHNHGKGSLYTSSAGSHRHSTKINNLGLDHKGSATELGRGQDQTNAQVYYSDYAGTHSHVVNGSTASSGSGTSHENRPPYFALAFIMKL
ncbi:MAG: hypothetical protein ABJF11_03760 [Reichenbachiella sp.]|uniref:hypothetical protein n=1 Tax=Reichenbachiella sp. TaxID=2184521 RepID=UPI0032640C8C